MKNPYDGLTFFAFFWQMLERMWLGLQGKLALSQLASDEIQMLVLIGVAGSSALVGTFLVLRKMTMLANALSHTILLGIVIAFVFTKSSVLSEDGHAHSLSIPVMLLAAFLTGLVTAFLTEFLHKVVRLQEDASIGLVFTSLFALGIVLVTLLTRQAHIGAEVVMGNVDALHWDDCKLIFTVFAINAVIVLLSFKAFEITTFDPALAQALGFSVAGFNYLLMAQTAATVVGAFRAVGVLMVLAFLTAPILTARLWTDDLKKLICLAILIGALASVVGVALSRHLLTAHGLALSTGGIVVCVLSVIFVLTILGKKLAFKFKPL